ncbi:ABC transporter ATP-binding protein [Pedobacter ginsengisoli]|uniref:ABC transporter ATP-binding protein n=1 Tax=Pedobacter ginsengisoli TaxID=363852 RepID=A0A2D1U188_9SPHI|nr:peptidase domain-containing ABC transporter [Pedobacter ginsengisoli]ATP55365.1 ABC transporter ATP-binding protein [Pedobacter ginsengisoli]
MSFKFIKQLNVMDCGPACIKMIAQYYGRNYSLETLRRLSGYSKQGTTMFELSKLSEKIGLRPRGVQLSPESLLYIDYPVILHWKNNHFVILLKISKFGYVKVADPAIGIVTYNKEEFLQGWLTSNNKRGNALLVEVSPKFYEQEGDGGKYTLTFGFFLTYLNQVKPQIIAIFAAFIFTLMIQMVTPFIMKSTIDIGIEGRNFGFIELVTIAQIVLMISSTVVGFIRSRISLRMANILNLSILSDFWIKLSRLPISYFDRYHTGDTMKRLGDHGVIQSFMTNTAINILTSIINFVLYSIILVSFNIQLFIIFLVGNFFYFLWIRAFMGVRRKLNHQGFELGAKNQSNTIELIQGMQEIKLNNAEHIKRWRWEGLQTTLFQFGFKMMNYNQVQSAGGLLISQIKDITLSLIVAKLVIDGQISFGTMVSVQYIIGQLSGPISSFIGLVQSSQDAKISLERLNDIHEVEEEEAKNRIFVNHLPENPNQMKLSSVSYTYPGAESAVIEGVNLDIPIGKMTAIVGESGGGKTTLLKILMKSYDDFKGTINIGDSDFKKISPSYWRSISGFVIHDGYIFNDTIGNNIALGDETPNKDWIIECCNLANIYEFIGSLPNGLETIIGSEGVGISQGQKQRILIARALYKKPKFLFFDEATNALDVNNETIILNNLKKHIVNKTVIVIAHRLSTIKDADQILLMKGGQVMERGNHNELIELKGEYWSLVRKQIVY